MEENLEKYWGWKGHTQDGRIQARRLLDCARCLILTIPIAEKAIDLRSSMNISLPDAVIAASALSLDAMFVTWNEHDFARIPGASRQEPVPERRIKSPYSSFRRWGA